MHFFLGILKVIDPAFLKQLENVDLTDEQKKEIRTTATHTRHYLEMSVQEVTRLRRSIRKGIRGDRPKPTEVNVLHRSDDARTVFKAVAVTAASQNKSEVTALDLTKALFDAGQINLELFKKSPKQRPDSKGARWEMIDGEKQPTTKQFAEWFGRNLTKLAAEGKLAPLFGREKETTTVIRVLARTDRRNVAIIGKPGIGKTALVEGTASALLGPKIPASLKSLEILELHGTDIAADCENEAKLNRRLTRLFETVGRMDKTVLFIDDLHGMFPSHLKPDTTCALLATLLGKNAPPLIVTTTSQEWKRLKENAPSLYRLFHTVEIAEPKPADYQGITDVWAKHIGKTQGTPFSAEAVRFALQASNLLPPERALPDRIVDLLENAATIVKVSLFSSKSLNREITIEDVRTVLVEHYGIKPEKVLPITSA